MKKNWNRPIVYILLIALLAQLFTGCGKGRESSERNQAEDSITEEFIQEEFVDQVSLTEDLITEEFIKENLIVEDDVYEIQIEEQLICQTYTFEIVAGVTTEEEIQALLPENIDEYDIDWPKVIGKFAVGTTVIVAVGIVHHVTNGAAYFVFVSPDKVAIDAVVGGAMEAAIKVAIKCVGKNKPTEEALKKYVIEGFADGYMWGAITSALRCSNIARKMSKLKLADGTVGKVGLDNLVRNKSGEVIGKVAYNKKGAILTEVASSSGVIKPLKYFGLNGKELTAAKDIQKVLQASKGVFPHNSKLNLGTADNALICETDDLGRIITENGSLLPNLEYTLNGYKYKTDDLGRIVSVSAEQLELKPVGRKRLDILNDIHEIGHGFEKAADDRGHLIGDQFNGNNTLANLVPMDRQVNQGNFKEIETLWADSLRNGQKVSTSIHLEYSGNSFRPDSFNVSYKIGNGEIVNTILENGLR